MDISDIELEFLIFIRVKIIIHVYNFCCKKYVVSVKNRMEVVNSKLRWSIVILKWKLLKVNKM